MRRPWPVTRASAIAIVALLMDPGSSAPPGEAQAKTCGRERRRMPSAATTLDRRRASPPACSKPLARADREQRVRQRRRHGDRASRRRKGSTARPLRPPGGAARASSWRLSRPRTALATRRNRRSRTCRRPCFPRSSRSSAMGPRVALGGTAPEDRDFVHAVYGKFPYVLAVRDRPDARSF